MSCPQSVAGSAAACRSQRSSALATYLAQIAPPDQSQPIAAGARSLACFGRETLRNGIGLTVLTENS
jgi:hypothetical protein